VYGTSKVNTLSRLPVELEVGGGWGFRGTCSGHPALARAIATLLRCQRAQLNQRAASTVAAAKAGGVVGALLIGGIEAAKHLFGK